MATKATCRDCGFKAKNNSGLAAHRRARHPEPEPGGSVEAAVRQDLANVKGAAALQQSALALGRRIDLTESARDLPALASELRATLASLGVAASEEATADAVDELTQRRAARRAAAADPPRATKSNKRRPRGG